MSYLDMDWYGCRPLSDVFPVDSPEEWEGLDVLVQRSDARVGVAAELEHGLLGRLGDRNLRRERQRVLPEHDLLVSVSRRLGAERGVACRDKKIK